MLKPIFSVLGKLNSRGVLGLISKGTAVVFGAGVGVGATLLVTKTNLTGRFAVPGLIAVTVIAGLASAATSRWGLKKSASRRLDRRMTAAEGLQRVLADDSGEMSALQAEYEAWRSQTEKTVPEGWKSNFKQAGGPAFAEFDETIKADSRFKRKDSPQKKLLERLEWDLHKLRNIKDKLQAKEGPETG